MPYLSPDEVLYLKAVRHGIEKILETPPQVNLNKDKINNIPLTNQQKKELKLTNDYTIGKFLTDFSDKEQELQNVLGVSSVENLNPDDLIQSKLTADQLSNLGIDSNFILYKRCADIRRKYTEDVSILQRIANWWKALFGEDNHEYADFMSNIRSILKNDQFKGLLTKELESLNLKNNVLAFPNGDNGSQFGCGKQIQYVFKSYESGWLREEGKLAKIFSKIPNFKNFTDGVIQQFQPGIKRNLWILFILFVLLLTCIIPGLNFIGIPVTLIAIAGLSPMIMTIVTQAALSIVGLLFWHSDKLLHPKSDYLKESIIFKQIPKPIKTSQNLNTSASQTGHSLREGLNRQNSGGATAQSSNHSPRHSP